MTHEEDTFAFHLWQEIDCAARSEKQLAFRHSCRQALNAYDTHVLTEHALGASICGLASALLTADLDTTDELALTIACDLELPPAHRADSNTSVESLRRTISSW